MKMSALELDRFLDTSSINELQIENKMRKVCDSEYGGFRVKKGAARFSIYHTADGVVSIEIQALNEID